MLLAPHEESESRSRMVAKISGKPLGVLLHSSNQARYA
jgi:hypothetical protein